MDTAGRVLSRTGETALTLLRYAWAGPNTLIGLLLTALILLGRGTTHAIGGVIEVHGPLASFLLRRCTLLEGGAAALTLGHVVLGRDESALEATRSHERVHVRQYERWGPAFLPAYAVASLWALARRAGAYRGNHFERQAVERSVTRVAEVPDATAG